MPVSGREYMNSEQINAEITHRVMMRHRSLTPHQRLKFGDRVLAIVQVRNIDERGREFELMCKEDLNS
jgi:SPP1 family predicted phage head-tail adaptor